MNISLDYDGTYTSDPNLWFSFALDAMARGHIVYIVTMRFPTEVNGKYGTVDKRLEIFKIPVICTSRDAKRAFCEKQGIKIDIWIDDNPEAVYNDANKIWGYSSHEGNIVDPAA